MKTLKNLWYDIRIGRRIEKLNRKLAAQEERDFQQAIAATVRAARENAVTVKAMHRALARAVKTA